MSRIHSFGRRPVGGLRTGTRRAGVIGALALVGVVGLATPAFAHHPVVSGSTVCSEGDHIVVWNIANGGQMQPRPDMTLTSVSANIDGTPYAVTDYATVIDPDGETGAQTIVPGNMTGTVVLNVSASWPDNIKANASTSVTLEEPCPPEATTTTTADPTTTTTASTTTTTVEKTTVVDAGSLENTTTTVSAAAGSNLPFTGSSSVLPMAGIIALCAGLALTVRMSRRHRRSL